MIYAAGFEIMFFVEFLFVQEKVLLPSKGFCSASAFWDSVAMAWERNGGTDFVCFGEVPAEP